MDKRFLQKAPHYYISRVSNKIQIYYDRNLRPFDITRSQLQILIALWIENPMCVKQIATFIDMSPQSVVELVNKLEQKGFLTRKVNSVDKRETLITLTQKGMELENQVMPVLTSLETGATSQDEVREIQTFMNVAQELTRNL